MAPSSWATRSDRRIDVLELSPQRVRSPASSGSLGVAARSPGESSRQVSRTHANYRKVHEQGINAAFHVTVVRQETPVTRSTATITAVKPDARPAGTRPPPPGVLTQDTATRHGPRLAVTRRIGFRSCANRGRLAWPWAEAAGYGVTVLPGDNRQSGRGRRAGSQPHSAQARPRWSGRPGSAAARPRRDAVQALLRSGTAELGPRTCCIG